MAKKKRKQYVKLQCTQCGSVNYFVKKSKGMDSSGGKLSLRKYCPHCRKHTLHKEMKR
ncbi:50S ribosomal protein L33 [bacterium]|nr:50S ribosomal protein L33 [bacterium]